ncbi:tetratricopeptide repeat protein [Myxococcota bacterium]|nr:tetratricopeptide repeat protein [Myxococcota bacterium]
MRKDDDRQALREEESALRGALEGPDPLAALLGLARLYLQVGEEEGAAAWLDQAQALARQQAGALSAEAGRCHALRAALHLSRQDADAAALEAERAVRLLAGSERARALLLLGQARLALGEEQAALRALDAAAEPTGPAAEGAEEDDALLAEVEQARAQAWLSRGDPAQALRHVRARVERVHRLHGPDSLPAADTLLLLAAACEAQGDLESAAAAADRAVQVLARVLGPEDPEVTMAAAWLLALHSRLAGAPAP